MNERKFDVESFAEIISNRGYDVEYTSDAILLKKEVEITRSDNTEYIRTLFCIIKKTGENSYRIVEPLQYRYKGEKSLLKYRDTNDKRYVLTTSKILSFKYNLAIAGLWRYIENKNFITFNSNNRKAKIARRRHLYEALREREFDVKASEFNI